MGGSTVDSVAPGVALGWQQMDQAAGRTGPRHLGALHRLCTSLRNTCCCFIVSQPTVALLRARVRAPAMPARADILRRQGSTAELRLLAAEFAYLDEQLAELAAQIAPLSTSAATTAPSTAAAPGAGGGGAAALQGAAATFAANAGAPAAAAGGSQANGASARGGVGGAVVHVRGALTLLALQCVACAATSSPDAKP